MRQTHRRTLLVPLLAVAASLASCESDPVAPIGSPTCPAGSAMIAVGDGYLQTLCGCAEASPTYYAAGTRLTCTINAGTRVFFHYIGTQLMHAIVPAGTPTFPASPVSDPSNSSTMIRLHAFMLNETGTYSFVDAMNEAITGDLVVN